MDFVTPAYRSASALARLLPGGVVDHGAPQLAELMAWRPSARRSMVERTSAGSSQAAGVGARRRFREVSVLRP